jgi:hypothetical protein
VIKGVYFEIKTPLGITVRTTKEYWEKIITLKHPSIAKYENKVKEALEEPDQIRRSKQDLGVNLYYKSLGEIYVCAVVDQIDSFEGYIITAYLTDRIKEGEQIYDKS